MLNRAEKAKAQWDKLLNILLCVYRTTPHSVIGFPPADLLNGRHLRGPLDLLMSEWLSEGTDQACLCDWLGAVQMNVRNMKECVFEKKGTAKVKMKQYHDKQR